MAAFYDNPYKKPLALFHCKLFPVLIVVSFIGNIVCVGYLYIYWRYLSTHHPNSTPYKLLQKWIINKIYPTNHNDANRGYPDPRIPIYTMTGPGIPSAPNFNSEMRKERFPVVIFLATHSILNIIISILYATRSAIECMNDIEYDCHTTDVHGADSRCGTVLNGTDTFSNPIVRTYNWAFFMANIFVPMVRALVNASFTMTFLYALNRFVLSLYPTECYVWFGQSYTYLYVVIAIVVNVLLYLPATYFYKIVPYRPNAGSGRAYYTYTITYWGSRRGAMWILYEILREIIAKVVPISIMVAFLIISVRHRMRQLTLTRISVLRNLNDGCAIPSRATDHDLNMATSSILRPVGSTKTRAPRGGRKICLPDTILTFIFLINIVVLVLPHEILYLYHKIGSILTGQQSKLHYLTPTIFQLAILMYTSVPVFNFFIYRIFVGILNMFN